MVFRIVANDDLLPPNGNTLSLAFVVVVVVAGRFSNLEYRPKRQDTSYYLKCRTREEVTLKQGLRS